MKKRIEQKLRLERRQLWELMSRMHQLGGSTLHPARTVTSTYFDTPELAMFTDTVEGCVPRKKLRVRCYGKHSRCCAQTHSLEIKMTTEEGRFKAVMPCSDWTRYEAGGIVERDYGICMAKVIVSYRREYYSVAGVRITIDSDISYRRSVGVTRSEAAVCDPETIVEIKASPDVSTDTLQEAFPWPTVHFSKYERAIEALYRGGW